MIHGYGSTSCSFYKLFKLLSVDRRVLAIDIIGMGLSSRKEISNEINDCDSSLDYFLDSI